MVINDNIEYTFITQVAQNLMPTTDWIEAWVGSVTLSKASREYSYKYFIHLFVIMRSFDLQRALSNGSILLYQHTQLTVPIGVVLHIGMSPIIMFILVAHIMVSINSN